MEELPAIGKISPVIFRELAFPHTEIDNETAEDTPETNLGANIVEVAGQAVSFATSPIFIAPECGLERIAWFIVHNAISNSVANGLPPKYLSLNLNLPKEMTEEQLALIWKIVHQECAKMDIAVIAEHIGRYDNCRYPLVGGATVTGVGAVDSYVDPKFVKPSDKILITKGPAIEATGILSTLASDYTERALGKDTTRKISDLFYKMSVVTEATIALSVGIRDDGISAMHTVSEGGIWGGLFELATSAGAGVKIDQDKIVMESGVAEVCRL